MLAAIASANKTRLPDVPLADGLAGRAEQKGLLTLLRQGRLRERLKFHCFFAKRGHDVTPASVVM